MQEKTKTILLSIKPRRRGPSEESRIFRNKVFEVIASDWPCYASEIVRKLGLPAKKKSLLLVKYHIDQLAREGKIKVKKIDRALVAWPSEIEKLRVIHELMSV
jgi:predicted transcriptional regulator